MELPQSCTKPQICINFIVNLNHQDELDNPCSCRMVWTGSFCCSKLSIKKWWWTQMYNTFWIYITLLSDWHKALQLYNWNQLYHGKLTKAMLFVPLYVPFSLSIGSMASAPKCSGKTGRRSSDRSLTMVLPVSNASFIVVTITPTGPRFTHPLQYTPERRVFVSSDLIIEKCWPRSKYQGQGQVIISHSICGM